MYKTLASSCVLAASLLTGAPAVQAQAQLSGTPDELREFLFPRPNTVNISGEGELTAFKDIAKVALQVETEARELNQAMAANEALRQELIDSFVGGGIDIENIHNARFSSSPQFGWFGNTPNRYEVSARLEVTVSSEQHLQLLASAADSHEEVRFEQTEFEHSLEDSFEAQVREMAMQDVMEQKAYYETTLGLELRAINFYYGGIRQLSRAMPQVSMAQEMAADTATRGTAPAAVSVAPSFDEVEYLTSVTVVFEIVSDSESTL